MEPVIDATVYIVDDDADVREALAWLLRSRRLLSECYRSAEDFEAEVLRRPPVVRRPSCLLLDMRMTGMSGLSLFNRMLERGEIDLLPTLRKTPERAERFAFSGEPISNLATMLTVKAGNRSIVAGNYETYNGMIVGMSRRGNGRNRHPARHGLGHRPHLPNETHTAP